MDAQPGQVGADDDEKATEVAFLDPGSGKVTGTASAAQQLIRMRATAQLPVMFNSDDGLGYLADRRLVPQSVLATLVHFGLSSICNLLAAISTAKLLGLGPDDPLTLLVEGVPLAAGLIGRKGAAAAVRLTSPLGIQP